MIISVQAQTICDQKERPTLVSFVKVAVIFGLSTALLNGSLPNKMSTFRGTFRPIILYTKGRRLSVLSVCEHDNSRERRRIAAASVSFEAPSADDQNVLFSASRLSRKSQNLQLQNSQISLYTKGRHLSVCEHDKSRERRRIAAALVCFEAPSAATKTSYFQFRDFLEKSQNLQN